MGASDVIRQAAHDIAQEYETGTYTPNGGDAVTCQLYMIKGIQPQPGAYDTQAWQEGLQVVGFLSELGQEPNRNDTMTIHGTTYTVQSVEENNGTTVRVNVREEA
jgi:hypothetical protein